MHASRSVNILCTQNSRHRRPAWPLSLPPIPAAPWMLPRGGKLSSWTVIYYARFPNHQGKQVIPVPSGRSLSLKIKQQSLCANGTAPDGCGSCQVSPTGPLHPLTMIHSGHKLQRSAEAGIRSCRALAPAFRRQRTSATPNWHTSSYWCTHSACQSPPLFV